MADPLVLLPDMMCDARVFAPQIAELSRETSVTVAPVCLTDRIEAMAQAVLAQAPRRFALAGLGLGGMVAMDVVRRAPDRLSRLALIAANPFAETPHEASLREPQIIRARSGRLAEVLREIVPSETLAPGPGRLGVAQRLHEMARDLGPEVFVRQSRALQRRRDQQAVLARCTVPTLILSGVHDPACQPRRQAFLAEVMPKATLVLLDDAGRCPPLETPEAVTSALRDWLGLPFVLR